MIRGKKIALSVLNGVLCVIVLLFLVDVFSPIDVKNQHLKEAVYFGVIMLPPLLLLANLVWQPGKKLKIGYSLFAIVIIIASLSIGINNIVFSSSSWKTQKIVYQHKHKSNTSIEFQMQDVGAHGYNRRTVQVTSLTPFFMFVRLVHLDTLDQTHWLKVDIDMNETGLKNQ